jgi:transposase
MGTPSQTDTQAFITGGVDAHKDTHHAAALDQHGHRLADASFTADTAGYQQLTDWFASLGIIAAIGVESTGSYAAGLTRHLRARGIDVFEVNRPHAYARAHQGKDDAIDAEQAARKVQSGQATAIPKDTTSSIEAIRFLKQARASAVKARSQALVQLQDLLLSAPASIREAVPASPRQAVGVCARLRPDPSRHGEPEHAAKIALRSIAVRIHDLDNEIHALDTHLDALVAQTTPTLLTRTGIGTGHAAQLAVTMGANHQRITTEAAFARLCGVAPIPVSSGKTNRMRLHRGGDRQANRALHMIAVCRLRWHEPTRAYAKRRTTEGLSKKDILRCLKRYIAREVFNDLRHDLKHT